MAIGLSEDDMTRLEARTRTILIGSRNAVALAARRSPHHARRSPHRARRIGLATLEADPSQLFSDKRAKTRPAATASRVCLSALSLFPKSRIE